MEKAPLLLLVDDDAAHRTMLKAHLGAEGFEIIEADDGDVAVRLAKERDIDLLLLDLKMKRVGGMEALQAVREAKPTLPVIMVTAFSSVESAVEAMRKGAFDYVTKPVDAGDLVLKVRRALDFDSFSVEKRALGKRFEFPEIVGRSRPIRAIFETLALVAPTDATVLIKGESGTGKELIADALHKKSGRAAGPFVKVNCAALQENLLESELFGHEKGAFTGASGQRKGRFEMAHGGTIFLDEIGDMSPATQAKILRVLQEKNFERVGGSRTIEVDVRLVAATHKDLEKMVEAGTFRRDLFFRLSVVPLELPSLSERPEDIPLLAEHFLKKYAAKNRKNIRGMEKESIDALLAYSWPGNIRELENALERAVILCPGERISVGELPAGVRETAGLGDPPFALRPGLTLKEMEKDLILSTLQENGGNRTRAARTLGISRQTLQNKLKEYDLS